MLTSAMSRLLCLAVLMAVGQAARIPRGIVNPYPDSHAVYHGHGATSYQNVKIESYDSRPVPTLDHHHHQHHHHKSYRNYPEQFVIQHLEEPHFVTYEVPSNVISSVDEDHHGQPFILVERDYPDISTIHDHGEHQYINIAQVPLTLNEIGHHLHNAGLTYSYENDPHSNHLYGIHVHK